LCRHGLMRRGEQSSPTIARVEALVRQSTTLASCPPGVAESSEFTTEDLIDITTATVLHNMVLGILLIVLLNGFSSAICAAR